MIIPTTLMGNHLVLIEYCVKRVTLGRLFGRRLTLVKTYLVFSMRTTCCVRHKIKEVAFKKIFV